MDVTIGINLKIKCWWTSGGGKWVNNVVSCVVFGKIQSIQTESSTDSCFNLHGSGLV